MLGGGPRAPPLVAWRAPRGHAGAELGASLGPLYSQSSWAGPSPQVRGTPFPVTLTKTDRTLGVCVRPRGDLATIAAERPPPLALSSPPRGGLQSAPGGSRSLLTRSIRSRQFPFFSWFMARMERMTWQRWMVGQSVKAAWHFWIGYPERISWWLWEATWVLRLEVCDLVFVDWIWRRCSGAPSTISCLPG